MEHHIRLPAKPEEIENLKVGDIVYVTGKIFTARDQAHKKMIDLQNSREKIPFDPAAMAVFHCGPLIKKAGGKYLAISAGPTTSARLTNIEPEFMRMFGTKMVIGKGGMGPPTIEAMKELGAVYLAYPGGVGALAAKSIKSVDAVYWLEELGMPEAVWIFDVEEFGPMVVGIAGGMSIYLKSR